MSMRRFGKDSFDYSSVLDLVVEMKPVDVCGSIKSGRRRSSIVAKPPEIFCVFCLENISFHPHIHCTECKRCDVNVCVPCFQMGAELGEHKRGHNYEVIYRCGPPIFESAPNEGPQWGVLEEQRLLGLIRTYKIEDWPKIALSEFGHVRTVEEAWMHFNRCFLNGPISEIVLENMIRPPIHAFGLSDPEIYTGEFFKPISAELIKNQIKECLEKLPNSNQLMNIVEYNELSSVRQVKSTNDLIDEHLENMICEFSHIHVEHSHFIPTSLPFSYPRCFIHERLTHLYKIPRNPANFLKEDEDEKACPKYLSDDNAEEDEESIQMPRSPTNSNRYTFRDKRIKENSSPSPSSSPNAKSSHDTPKNRERRVTIETEEEPSVDKNRGKKRDRKSSSSSTQRSRQRSRTKRKRSRIFNANRRMARAKRRFVPRAAPIQVQGQVVRRHSQRQLESSYFTREQLLSYRLTHHNLSFIHREAPLLTKQQIKKFDSDDLNLIAYNPKRDDFEHEYRNAAEHFISKIFLNGECLVVNELEQFKNAVRVARIHRYNRVLERRFANHSMIRDHQLLNEFFSVVKSNVNERGKYNLFVADSFPSKKRAEELRPYFAKLRRVLPNTELTSLAEDIAEMESLMTRIKLLRSMQTSGITEIKGRLKSELTAVSRNRKRKAKKPNEGELRKANLRWERIKRWSKKAATENI